MIAFALELQRDTAFFRLARVNAIGLRFDTVVHRIAQHVHQRIHQLIDDLAVHHGVGADAFQLHALARGPCRLAHASLDPRHDGLHRDHARAHDGLLAFPVDPALMGEHVVEIQKMRFHGAADLS